MRTNRIHDHPGLGYVSSPLRLLAILVIATALVAGLAGCGGNDPDTRKLSGVVTDVNASNITDVESFTIRSEDESHEIFVDPDIAYDFPPSHLSEHLLSGEPVAADVEDRDGRLFALTLRDAT